MMVGSRNSFAARLRNSLKSRMAFTLLELILALALSVVVITAIASAIHMYLNTLNRQQQDIERKQVARSVLNMIRNDLRAGIQYKAEDYSGLENLRVSQELALLIELASGEEADGESVEGGEGETPESSTEGGGETPEDGEADGGEASEEEEDPGRPTLIGNNQVLRIDISRLPRIDQYNPLVANLPVDGQLTSDVKTITYFFSKSAPTRSNDVLDNVGLNGGLYRRQMDRAVEAFSGDAQIIDNPDIYAQLVSAEVSELSFRYWDGEQWVDQWDSNEDEGFPVAIEIRILIDPFRNQGNPDQNYVEEETLEYYRTVVHLPVAELPPEEDE